MNGKISCYTVVNDKFTMFQNNKGQASKLQQQPSISITPLPRQPSGTPPNAHSTGVATGSNKPGHPSTGGKATFVICEICDGYIKVCMTVIPEVFLFRK